MKKILAGLVFAVLAACSTSSKLPTAQNDISAVEFAKELRYATSNAGDALVGGTIKSAAATLSFGDIITRQDADKEIDAPTHRALVTWWCPRHNKVSSYLAVKQQFASLCSSKNGIWLGAVCESKSDGEPIFFADVKDRLGYVKGGNCSDQKGSVNVYVVEPKANTGTAYWTALRFAGYKTKADLAAEEEQKKLAVKNAEQEGQQRVQRAEYLQRNGERGMRICFAERDRYTVGFILERAPKGKFLIKLDAMGLEGSSVTYASNRFGRVGDTTFIVPEDGWYACERR